MQRVLLGSALITPPVRKPELRACCEADPGFSAILRTSAVHTGRTSVRGFTTTTAGSVQPALHMSDTSLRIVVIRRNRFQMRIINSNVLNDPIPWRKIKHRPELKRRDKMTRLRVEIKNLGV